MRCSVLRFFSLPESSLTPRPPMIFSRIPSDPFLSRTPPFLSGRVLYAGYLVWQAHSRQHNLLLNMEKGTNTAMLPGGDNYGTAGDGGNA